MNEINLKVEDMELRIFSIDEAYSLYQLIEKNRVQVGKWLLWVDKIISVEDAEELIQEFSRRREKVEGMNFGIWYQNKLIGYISYAQIDHANKKAGIAYWLDTEYQGKGIITKSCKLLIEYAFGELNLDKIEISCADGNYKSRAIPQRLGFKEERVIKDSEEIRGGKFVDNHLYALLKQDWKK